MTLPACDRIIELSEKATPGPWTRKQVGGGFEIHAPQTSTVAGNYDYEEGGILHEKDADFITETRNLAKPLALALNEAVRAMKEECAKFRFPDEDRPILHEALARINELLK